MTTLRIHLRDHHDLIWNKGFTEHIRDASGNTIRPYAEREAAQFDRWLEILPGSAASLQIEQAASIRQYIADQPHRRSELQALVDAGQIEYMGGGESVIDNNLVHGESIYRNYLYGFRWLEKEFGVRPGIAFCPDTFGLPASLPQICRQFGMDWLPMYTRIFHACGVGIETEHVRGLPHRPFWQGIDGSLLCIEPEPLGEGARFHRDMQNHQYRACPRCQGEGCAACEWRGFAAWPEHGHETLEVAVQRLIQAGDGDIVIAVDTEEALKTSDYLQRIVEIASRYGLELEWGCYQRLRETRIAELLSTLHEGQVDEDLIDGRREGNPIASGCHTVRSLLKRGNRDCEHLLLAAEHWSALAVGQGLGYPREALAGLWRLLSLSQFHDGITGSHPDAPHHEQRSWLRRIRSGAGRLLLRAVDHLAARIVAPAVEDALPVAVFNHLAWAQPTAVVELALDRRDVDPHEELVIAGWDLRDAEGHSLPLLAWERQQHGDRERHLLTLLARDLPPCGWTTLQLAACGRRLDEDVAEAVIAVDEAAGQAATQTAAATAVQLPLQPIDGQVIDNGRFRIAWNERGLTAIDDMVLGERIAHAGSLDPIAHDDIGSLWETMHHLGQRLNLADQAAITLGAWRGEGCQLLRIDGRIDEPIAWEQSAWEQELRLCNRDHTWRMVSSDEAAPLLRSCRWRHELWLLDGCDEIRCRTTLACDSEHLRILLPIEIGFTTPQDRAVYEIPYGAIERPSYVPMSGMHCGGDGTWPTLQWLAAHNEMTDYSVAVFNRGIAGQRFIDGRVELHLLRSPLVNVWGSTPPGFGAGLELARECGEQVYDYALCAGRGSHADLDCTRRAQAFNAHFTARPLAVGPGEGLPARHSLLAPSAEGVLVAAIKREENGEALVLRCQECGGRSGNLRIHDTAVEEISPMEDRQLGVFDADIPFAAWQIRTLRLR